MTADNVNPTAPWTRPDPELVAAFARYPVANIGDAAERLNIVDGGIHPIWHGAKAVGTALPIMTVAGDNRAVIDALEYIRPGDLLMINAFGFEGRAIIGDNLAQRFEFFGASGAVVDGYVRDRDIIEGLGFPVFARGLTPAGPFKNGPGTIGEPVAIGGVVVNAGDIVVADSDGVIVIRPHRAREILRAVEEIAVIEAEKDAEVAAMRALRASHTDAFPESVGAPMSPFDLTGRRALVTGSSRGIGFAIADGLAAAGATLVLNGVDPDRLAAAGQALTARYSADRIRTVRFDITDESAVDAGIAEIEDEAGPIEILVNNAGIQHRVPMLELELADWKRVIDVDLTSAFIVGRAARRRMIPRGSGKIINVCSVQTDLARPTIAPYTAAKGGLRNLTRAMTAEWAASGLQINGIAPGYIHTEMTQNLVDDEAFNSWILGRTPAGRWGRIDDLIGPAVWLASRASDYVNGQVVFIDGGMSVVV